MVTLKEYQEASDDTLFVHKDNGFRQNKVIMRFKINQIADAYVKGVIAHKQDPREIQYAKELQEILKETLEHFDMIIPKILEEPKRLKSRDGKGEFCHSCGLQKENTRLVEEGDMMKRKCMECLGI